MRDMDFSVWTRIGGEPTRMGSLYVTESEARFSYANAYAQSGLPGLSLVYPPALFRDSTIVHRRSGSLHPRFHALIPPADEHNFQRKLMLAYLREKGVQPATPFEADLALLAHTGHGGIGHVDVFTDDGAAEAWYANADSGPLVPLGDQFGFSLKEMISWLDADARFILESLGPTPSVGGAIPKLLVAIPAGGWDGRISLPNRTRRADRIDVVLKIERSTTYPGLAALEAMEKPDLQGATLTLASLARVVDSLPLRPAGSAARETEGDADAEAGAAGRAWASVKRAASGLVRVTPPDETAMPLLTPDAEYFLRTNLTLQLQVARLALLRGEQAVFEESLADADDWLRAYFDTDSAQVRGARATIEEIRGSMIVVTPPDISGSLQLLRQFNNLSGTAQ